MMVHSVWAVNTPISPTRNVRTSNPALIGVFATQHPGRWPTFALVPTAFSPKSRALRRRDARDQEPVAFVVLRCGRFRCETGVLARCFNERPLPGFRREKADVCAQTPPNRQRRLTCPAVRVPICHPFQDGANRKGLRRVRRRLLRGLRSCLHNVYCAGSDRLAIAREK